MSSTYFKFSKKFLFDTLNKIPHTQSDFLVLYVEKFLIIKNNFLNFITLLLKFSKLYNIIFHDRGGEFMTIEEKLKELILNRYHSIREFTIQHDIPYTTMVSIFKRGVDNSSLTNIIKICKALNISAAVCEIVPAQLSENIGDIAALAIAKGV